MTYDTTKALVDLTASVSHDPDEADWFDVIELVELIPNPTAVLLDLLRLLHEDYL